MGKHKENKGKKGGWKNKKKWESDACCSTLDNLTLDEGNCSYDCRFRHNFLFYVSCAVELF